MIRKNLVLLEYMVKNRIEEDSKRLDAIKKVNDLLLAAKIDMDNIAINEQETIIKKLVAIKKRPLSYLEYQLIEEIFKLN